MDGNGLQQMRTQTTCYEDVGFMNAKAKDALETPSGG